MRFIETPLSGAYLIELEEIPDARGFFARTFCRREFAERGLDGEIVQINTSLSTQAGTLRGMHYQLRPKAETKIVRCIRGALYDVILDIRPNSATFGQWYAAELNAKNRRMICAPKGFAHGFLTLEHDSEVLYLVTALYSRDHERCIRWNDPKFSIEWPFEPAVLSDKDRNQADFDPAHHLGGASESHQ